VSDRDDGDGGDDGLGQSNVRLWGGPLWNLRHCVLTWTSAASVRLRPHPTIFYYLINTACLPSDDGFLLLLSSLSC
jgi:hypothetical protein